MRAVVALLCLIVAAQAFELTSKDFRNGGNIPREFTCDDPEFGHSPQLSWFNAPAGTQYYVLVAYDETSSGVFNHWFLSHIPESMNELPRGASKDLPKAVSVKYSYIPICPPQNEQHTFKFELFALDRKVALSDDLMVALEQLKFSSLDSAVLTGTYGGKNVVTQLTKRDVAAALAPNLLNVTLNLTGAVAVDVRITVTDLNIASTTQTENVRSYEFPVYQAVQPVPGRWRRVEPIFTLTVLSGEDICIYSGFTRFLQPVFASPNYCTSASQKTIIVPLPLDLTPTSDLFVRYWIAIRKQGPGQTQYSGVVSIRTFEQDAPDEAVPVVPGLRQRFGIPSINYRRVHEWPYVLPPALARGAKLRITLTVTAAVETGDPTDTFNICFAGGFTPFRKDFVLQNTNFVCKQKNTPDFTITWFQDFDTLPINNPVLLVGGGPLARKRNVLTTGYSLQGGDYTQSAIPAASTAATGTGVVYNFAFANQFVIGKL